MEIITSKEHVKKTRKKKQLTFQENYHWTFKTYPNKDGQESKQKGDNDEARGGKNVLQTLRLAVDLLGRLRVVA